MKILIIGGTLFVGRALTTVAQSRGHAVTLLNRGKTATKLPAGVEHIQADRDAGLEMLATGSWDAVVDTCAYYPRQVRSLLAALPGEPHYTLVSSVSAYSDFTRKGLDESAELSVPLMDDSITSFDRHTYGPLKSGCEQAAGPDALIIRPGIIVGPHDPTGRFAYWVRRLAATETFLAPGDGSTALQIIDVRDLAAWMVHLVEQKVTGAFNAVGPALPLHFGEFIQIGLHTLESRALPRWVGESVLAENKIEGGSMLPLWIPSTAENLAGMFEVDGRKAWLTGLQLRGLVVTIRDVATYEVTVGKPVKVGLSSEDEHALLARLSRP